MADRQLSLAEQVRSGENRQLQILAAGGLLPLATEELIELQVDLALAGDAEVAATAAQSLGQQEPRVLASLVAQNAPPRVVEYLARHHEHPSVLEAVLRRRDVSRDLLIEMARRLPPDLQEVLILRQDAIVEEPRILSALEENPAISSYAQRRITEYREHLLPQARLTAASMSSLIGPVLEDDEFLQREIQVVKALPASGEFDEQTGLSEGQIRLLPVPARMRLARNAGRALRSILIRDPVAQIAMSVIQGNTLPDSEVEQIAKSRIVVEDILAEIGSRREWQSKYQIVKALVQNPRTPLATSLRLVPRLSVRDLRDLGRDRNLPDAVRSLATRLYRIKLK